MGTLVDRFDEHDGMVELHVGPQDAALLTAVNIAIHQVQSVELRSILRGHC